MVGEHDPVQVEDHLRGPGGDARSTRAGSLTSPGAIAEDMASHLAWTEIVTPIGPFRLVGVGGVVLQAAWAPGPPPDLDAERDDAALAEAAAEVVAWMAGERTTFTVPVAPAGTPFQQMVWAAVRELPFGETATYGGLAHHLRSPNGARAVGAANGANPIPLLIPCHRVIGARGELVGYGGGTDVKAWLLDHERRVAGAGQPPLPLGLRRRHDP